MGVNQDILITNNNAKSLLLLISGHIPVPCYGWSTTSRPTTHQDFKRQN